MAEQEAEPVVRRHRTSKASRSGRRSGGESTSGRSTRSKVVIGVLIALIVAVATALGGALWGLWSFSRIDRVHVKLSEVAAPSEPFNMLVVGSDSRENITSDDPSAGGMLGRDVPSGQRSDSLMVARVDLANKRVDLLSIPRDLWLPIAGKGRSQRINTAYATSAQTTIDTIETELGIPINHFAEVDFTGFRSLVNALGGVPMYFAHPVKDKNSGLNIATRGCVVLDGEQGLAFARSRHLKWHDGERWRSDETGDLGRMTRQQLLTRASLAKAQTLGLSDVTKLKGLVDAAVGSVKLDTKWGAGDLIAVGRQLTEIDPQRMQTHSLAVTPHTTSGGAAVLLLDEAASAPVLDIFRGSSTAAPVTTTTVPPPQPGDVSVRIINSGSGDGEGRRVGYVLESDGFTILDVASGSQDVAHSTVTHAKGQRAFAELVAGWINPRPKIRENPKLGSGRVTLELGSDFAKVFAPEQGTPAHGGSGQAGGTGGEDPEGDGQPADGGPSGQGDAVTSTTVASTTTTTQPGWTPGVPPAGTVCR